MARRAHGRSLEAVRPTPSRLPPACSPSNSNTKDSWPIGEDENGRQLSMSRWLHVAVSMQRLRKLLQDFKDAINHPCSSPVSQSHRGDSIHPIILFRGGFELRTRPK